jgi:hypothetical protein
MFKIAFWKFLVWNEWLRMFLYCCVMVYLVSVTWVDVSKCILEVSRLKLVTHNIFKLICRGLPCQRYLSWCFKVYFGNSSYEMYDSEGFYAFVSRFILSTSPQLMFQSVFSRLNRITQIFLYSCVVTYLVIVTSVDVFKVYFRSFAFETNDSKCSYTVVSWFTSVDVSKYILEVSLVKRKTQNVFILFCRGLSCRICRFLSVLPQLMFSNWILELSRTKRLTQKVL